MKNFNKLASLILAALMLCLSVFGVSAAGLIGETLDMIIMGGEEEQEELMPMMAMRCLGAYPAYPDNDGFLGDYSVVTLPAGTELCQYRRPTSTGTSRFFCMPGTPAESLALPPLKKVHIHV